MYLQGEEHKTSVSSFHKFNESFANCKWISLSDNSSFISCGIKCVKTTIQYITNNRVAIIYFNFSQVFLVFIKNSQTPGFFIIFVKFQGLHVFCNPVINLSKWVNKSILTFYKTDVLKLLKLVTILWSKRILELM